MSEVGTGRLHSRNSYTILTTANYQNNWMFFPRTGKRFRGRPM